MGVIRLDQFSILQAEARLCFLAHVEASHQQKNRGRKQPYFPYARHMNPPLLMAGRPPPASAKADAYNSGVQLRSGARPCLTSHEPPSVWQLEVHRNK